jgi:hypothetical protein
VFNRSIEGAFAEMTIRVTVDKPLSAVSDSPACNALCPPVLEMILRDRRGRRVLPFQRGMIFNPHSNPGS